MHVLHFSIFEMTKWKLTNKVHPSQIGYYKSGEWNGKLLYNFKFIAYLHDPVKKQMGWSGLVRADECRDRPIPVFFPNKTLENYKSFRDHIRSNTKLSVVLAGKPDTPQQWTEIIESYAVELGLTIFVF